MSNQYFYRNVTNWDWFSDDYDETSDWNMYREFSGRNYYGNYDDDSDCYSDDDYDDEELDDYRLIMDCLERWYG